MHIDIMISNIQVKNHTYRCANGEKYRNGMTGEKYALFNYNRAFYADGIQWMDAFSVYWTAEELKAFRPNDTVHSFLRKLEQERVEEIAHLKKKVKTAKTAYKGMYYEKPFNEKEHIQNKIKFLENHSIVLAKITFE